MVFRKTEWKDDTYRTSEDGTQVRITMDELDAIIRVTQTFAATLIVLTALSIIKATTAFRKIRRNWKRNKQ